MLLRDRRLGIQINLDSLLLAPLAAINVLSFQREKNDVHDSDAECINLYWNVK